MPKIIPRSEQSPTPGGTVIFEGKDHGSGVSIYVVNAEPGRGPDLHTHPYSETWVIHAGEAMLTAGETTTRCGPGTIAVVEANVPHKFKCLGPERLQIVCIHASPVFVQVDLE